jgi:hypothetical protein
MRKAASWLLLLGLSLGLCLLPLPAHATDPELVDIYNALFQTNLTAAQLDQRLVTNDELQGAMSGQVRAEAMFGQSNSFVLGTYSDPGVGTQTTDLFTVTTHGYLMGQPRVNFTRAAAFGFHALPGAFARKFSEAALNPGGADNLHTYSTPQANVYMLAWEETDNLADTDFNDLVVTLRVDTPPVAVAATLGSGPFPAAPNHRAQVGLDGSGSSDADGDPLTYSWSWTGGAATGLSPTIDLPEGDTTITLVVNDGIVDSAPATVVVSVSPSPNVAPVAEAGQDQTVSPALNHYAAVTLNGSGSSDLNGDPLTYEWTWAGGSASGVAPTISLYEGQTYTISLRVSDGQLWSDYDTCSVTVGTVDNIAPVVTPPADRSLHAGQDGVAHVSLTAYGYDANSDPLTYGWSGWGGQASGETVAVDLPENPTLPTSPITYDVSVQAFDGLAYSPPGVCHVTVLPAAPVACAGPDPAPVSADLNHHRQVTLDGSASTSRYGLPLTYHWTWGGGGSATGQSPTITLPEGLSTVTLVVNDGSYDSAPDTVAVDIMAVPNYAPVAEAGDPQTANPAMNHRATVQLDGTRSFDPNSDPLTYTWTWTDLGTGQPQQATGPTPQVGLYEGVNTITLAVSDGQLQATDTVDVTVTTVPNVAPVAVVGPDQSVYPRLDRTAVVHLDGSGSHDDNSDPLTYSWTWLDPVTGQLKSETGVKPSIIVPIGATTVQLVVNDGQVNSTNEAAVHITVNPLQVSVPSDFASVQEAIDAVLDGDTVLVERGTFYGTVNFNGKAITVKGVAGWEHTTLQLASGGASVVTFASWEGPSSRLLDLTLKGGLNVSGGSAIRIDNASPTIVSCYLTGNSQGGAVFVSGSSAVPRLANLLIYANNVSTNGSAFWITNGARPAVTNCTIYGNVGSGNSAAIVLEGGCQAQFRDCIIWGNSPTNIRDAFTASSFSHCDVGPAYSPVGGEGNIVAEPGFKTGSLSSFYLKQVGAGGKVNSKCVNAGSTTVDGWLAEMAVYGADVAAELAEGNTRNDGQPDTGQLDLGFHHHPAPVRALSFWITDTSGGTVTRLFRGRAYFFWVKYQVEGKAGTMYQARRAANITGPFNLNRAASYTDVKGTYTQKLGNLKKPITVPNFSLPPGQSSVNAKVKMTVQVKKKGTTAWLGSDYLETEVEIH